MKKLVGCLVAMVSLASLGSIGFVLLAMFVSIPVPNPNPTTQTIAELEPPSRESESIDLFAPAGDAVDRSITIHCYCLSRVAKSDEIISQAKTLAKSMSSGKEVAYIFNANANKSMIRELIETTQAKSQFSDKLQKWMHDNHFASISYMDGTHWELIQWNDVASRTFNNKMESIRLSQ